MPSIIPPQTAPSWTHSPDDVTRIIKEAIEKHRKLMDEIANIKDSDCTFANVILPLALADTELNHTAGPLLIYSSVSSAQELRDASTNAESVREEYRAETSMRRDLFHVKQAAADNIRNSGKKLEPEEQRLVDKMVLDGKRAGLALPERVFAELSVLQKELSNACLEFNKNFAEEKEKISFTLEELDGVPEDEISGFTKRLEGKQEIYDVSFNWSTNAILTTYSEKPETRKRVHEGFWSRLAINVPVFEKMIELRRKVATLLGYASWADYVTEIRMAKTAKNVADFLSDLEQKLRPLGLKEREGLLALKQEEHKAKGLPFDGEYYTWDYNYYHEKYIKKNLDLDSHAIKEYFPADFVVDAILRMYQDLLGVKFVEMEGSTWHPDVQQFAVWENSAEHPSDFIGYCYLDIFFRDEKNGQPYMSPICAGYIKADGTRSFPVVAMVASFAQAAPGKPSLLTHSEVKTFFHEMGHVFHELLSKTRFAQFHGTIGPVDYAEAPSQMLEHWCWEPRVLEKLSCHYQTKKSLSPELIDKLLKSRYVNVGLSELRLVFYASYDLKVHMAQETDDYTTLWNKLCETIALEKCDKLVPGQAAFHYMVGEYSAGFYSYAWSNVFAADMYATVFKSDPLDAKRWQRYRESILLPGSSRDELILLKDFLGRSPNAEAFVRGILGGSASEKTSEGL